MKEVSHVNNHNNEDKSYRVLFSKDLTKDLYDLKVKIKSIKEDHLIIKKQKNDKGIIEVVSVIDDDKKFLNDLSSVINNTVIDSLKWKVIHAFYGADPILKKLYVARQNQIEDIYGINSIENYLVTAALNDRGKILSRKQAIDEFVTEAEIHSMISNHPEKYLPLGTKSPLFVINNVIYSIKNKSKIIIEEYRQKRLGRFAEKLSDFLFGLENKLPSDLLGQRIQVSADMLHESTKQLKKLADAGSYYPEWIVFNYKDSMGSINAKIDEAVRLNSKYKTKTPDDIPKEDRLKMLPRVEVDLMLNKYPVQTLVQDHKSGIIYKEGVISHENFYFNFRSNDRQDKYSQEGLSQGAEYISNMVLRLLAVSRSCSS